MKTYLSSPFASQKDAGQIVLDYSERVKRLGGIVMLGTTSTTDLEKVVLCLPDPCDPRIVIPGINWQEPNPLDLAITEIESYIVSQVTEISDIQAGQWDVTIKDWNNRSNIAWVSREVLITPRRNNIKHCRLTISDIRAGLYETCPVCAGIKSSRLLCWKCQVVG